MLFVGLVLRLSCWFGCISFWAVLGFQAVCGGFGLLAVVSVDFGGFLVLLVRCFLGWVLVWLGWLLPCIWGGLLSLGFSEFGWCLYGVLSYVWFGFVLYWVDDCVVARFVVFWWLGFSGLMCWYNMSS